GDSFGLLATKTIREGDTRYTGLRWIRQHGGCIYHAERRFRWPGVAAVIVSIVHVSKSEPKAIQLILDEVPVLTITAYLFHFVSDDNPSTLRANHPFVHSGTNINGKGFVLTPVERSEFIRSDPRNTDRIRAYLGAEEMNESPEAIHCRFAIYMEGLSEADAKTWPELYRHLHATVRLQRQDSSEKRLREFWWTYSRPAKELY